MGGRNGGNATIPLPWGLERVSNPGMPPLHPLSCALTTPPQPALVFPFLAEPEGLRGGLILLRPHPGDLAPPASPSLGLSFSPGAAADPCLAARCSAAPRPRGGSVGLALAPPGAAETSQPPAPGSETFPLAQRSRLPPAPSSRRGSAPPPSTCPGFAAGLGRRPAPHPPTSPCCFLLPLSRKLLSWQQLCQRRAWKSRPAWSARGRGRGAAATIPRGVWGGEGAPRCDLHPGPASARLLRPAVCSWPLPRARLCSSSPASLLSSLLSPLALSLLNNMDSVSRGP